tara:strand:- start:184 stop:1260 length:1077 start_codon:yes stop_codon:yes gene_type:complete
MDRISYNSSKLLNYFENLNPQKSGIFFSITIHLLILLFMVGLPNFFSPKEIYVPNIIPIEILNVSENTNLKKTEIKNQDNKNKETITKQKKFNSSEQLEVKKNLEINKTNIEEKTNPDQPVLETKQSPNLEIKEKEKIIIKEKEIVETKKKIETIKSDKIKPKLKPKPEPKIINNENTKSDLDLETNIKDKPKLEKEKSISKPKPKPEKEFSITSMLKDLRNEKTNIVENETIKEVDDLENKSTDESKKSAVLSISEIDLLRQQLSSCWNAPAGAVIEPGMVVKISAKVLQNMKVSSNSVRIVDTNIAKTNPFYGPITDSAMRTLLNPECTPLKLPKDKYNLWKDLTITFDYSIMKGY